MTRTSSGAAPLPPCDAEYATLPYRDEPYQATLDEIEAHFVQRAPVETRGRRALVMRALRLHCDIVQAFAKKHSIATRTLLDGGFVTWKSRSPEDADVVVFVPPEHYARFVKARALPLWTLSDVSATLGGGGDPVTVGTLRPGFGLVDSYVNPDLALQRRQWHDLWSALRDPETNDPVQGARKGYIEVVTE